MLLSFPISSRGRRVFVQHLVLPSHSWVPLSYELHGWKTSKVRVGMWNLICFCTHASHESHMWHVYKFVIICHNNLSLPDSHLLSFTGAAGCLSGALSGLAPKELQPVAEGFRSWPRQAGWTRFPYFWSRNGRINLVICQQKRNLEGLEQEETIGQYFILSA